MSEPRSGEAKYRCKGVRGAPRENFETLFPFDFSCQIFMFLKICEKANIEIITFGFASPRKFLSGGRGAYAWPLDAPRELEATGA